MSQAVKIAAVVLAGGHPTDGLTAGGPARPKALVPIDGRPMVSYVLAAIRQCQAIALTVYVGQTDPALAGWFDVSVPGGSRLADSLALGLGAALGAGADGFLIITADVPWVDGAVLTRFIVGARSGEHAAADLVYAVVERATALAAFPDQRRTFVTLEDGTFTGGNAAYLTRAAVDGLLPVVDRFYRARKNPVALAGLMGLGTLFALVLGRASIARLEARAGALLGVRARALISPDAAIAADVDRPAHLPRLIDAASPGATDGRAQPDRARPVVGGSAGPRRSP